MAVRAAAASGQAAARLVVQRRPVNARKFICKVVPRHGASWALWSVVVGACRTAETPSSPPPDDTAMVATEGVLILPTGRSEEAFGILRLYELAESLRPPAAQCFLERAIATMVPDAEDPRGYRSIPEGQLKLRIRVGADGKLAEMDVSDNRFQDPEVPRCFSRLLESRAWPETSVAYALPLDVVYWVHASPPGAGDEWSSALRRQTAEVATRGATCVEPHLSPGEHTFEALVLVGRSGDALATRVEPDRSGLPEDARGCLAHALRETRLAVDETAFVRPVRLVLRYAADDAGALAVHDGEWLRRLQLEELARRAQQQALAGVAPTPVRVPGRSEVNPSSSDAVDTSSDAADTSIEAADPSRGPEGEPGASEDPSETAGSGPGSGPAADPGQSGLRLDLSGRGSP